MAIKDRQRRRLVRLGVIRLGVQVPNASGKGTHPTQTDYFVLKDAPEIEAYYHEQGIDEVRELDVLLPFPDIERNFDAWYQVWAGGVLVCQGDGEYVQYATPFRVTQDDKGTHVYNAPGDTLISNGVAQVAFDWNGEHFVPGELVPCPGADKDAYPHCGACRLGCLLKVMMADPALFRMGYYQIATGSKRNYDTIMGTLELMPANQVNGIPFKLRLVEESITYQENGQRKKSSKHFLQLEPDPTITRKLYQRATERMIGEPPPRAALAETSLVWDTVDPAAPPPFVEVGVDASSPDYYADDLQGNGYLEGELPPATERDNWNADMPSVAKWGGLHAAAVSQLCYADADAVKQVLADVFDGATDKLTHAAAWQALVDHQMAKEPADA